MLLLMCVLAVDPRVSVTVEAAGEVVLSERSAGTGVEVDGVFGARVLAVPSVFPYVGASLDVRAGTLGGKTAVGTVQVTSTDVRMDALFHGRFPVALRRMSLIPSVLLGFDASVQAQQLQVADAVSRRVAFIPGFSYGLRVALEGYIGWSVAITALLRATCSGSEL
jgi:hypothetical protein